MSPLSSPSSASSQTTPSYIDDGRAIQTRLPSTRFKKQLIKSDTNSSAPSDAASSASTYTGSYIDDGADLFPPYANIPGISNVDPRFYKNTRRRYSRSVEEGEESEDVIRAVCGDLERSVEVMRRRADFRIQVGPEDEEEMKVRDGIKKIVRWESKMEREEGVKVALPQFFGTFVIMGEDGRIIVVDKEGEFDSGVPGELVREKEEWRVAKEDEEEYQRLAAEKEERRARKRVTAQTLPLPTILEDGTEDEEEDGIPNGKGTVSPTRLYEPDAIPDNSTRNSFDKTILLPLLPMETEGSLQLSLPGSWPSPLHSPAMPTTSLTKPEDSIYKHSSWEHQTHSSKKASSIGSNHSGFSNTSNKPLPGATEGIGSELEPRANGSKAASATSARSSTHSTHSVTRVLESEHENGVLWNAEAQDTDIVLASPPMSRAPSRRSNRSTRSITPVIESWDENQNDLWNLDIQELRRNNSSSVASSSKRSKHSRHSSRHSAGSAVIVTESWEQNASESWTGDDQVTALSTVQCSSSRRSRRASSSTSSVNQDDEAVVLSPLRPSSCRHSNSSRPKRYTAPEIWDESASWDKTLPGPKAKTVSSGSAGRSSRASPVPSQIGTEVTWMNDAEAFESRLGHDAERVATRSPSLISGTSWGGMKNAKEGDAERRSVGTSRKILAKPSSVASTTSRPEDEQRVRNTRYMDKSRGSVGSRGSSTSRTSWGATVGTHPRRHSRRSSSSASPTFRAMHTTGSPDKPSSSSSRTTAIHLGHTVPTNSNPTSPVFPSRDNNDSPDMYRADTESVRSHGSPKHASGVHSRNSTSSSQRGSRREHVHSTSDILCPEATTESEAEPYSWYRDPDEESTYSNAGSVSAPSRRLSDAGSKLCFDDKGDIVFRGDIKTERTKSTEDKYRAPFVEDAPDTSGGSEAKWSGEASNWEGSCHGGDIGTVKEDQSGFAEDNSTWLNAETADGTRYRQSDWEWSTTKTIRDV